MTSAQRARLRTFPYLLRALIPLTLFVVLAVIFAWPRDADETKVTTVDPSPAIAQARERAPYPLLAPAPSGPSALGQHWRPTSTRIEAGATDADPFAFRISYVTPDGEYAMFLESDDAPAAVAAIAGPTEAKGDHSIDGATWTRAETSKKGETVLTRTIGDVTVLVTGSASLDELSELAGSLS